MKRFWDQASLQPGSGGYALLLDGKPLQLPQAGPLMMANFALAEAIRDEWQRAGGAKGGEFRHAVDLPLTQMHSTATCRVASERDAMIKAIAAYGDSDLLCYRAEIPAILRERQDRAWQPWLDWAQATLNAPLRVASGVLHVAQPEASLAALRLQVAACSDVELAALGVMVPTTGSLVLGLAMVHGALSAAEAHRIARVDEAHQSELWGSDAEAAARAAVIEADLRLAEKFLHLARD